MNSFSLLDHRLYFDIFPEIPSLADILRLSRGLWGHGGPEPPQWRCWDFMGIPNYLWLQEDKNASNQK